MATFTQLTNGYAFANPTDSASITPETAAIVALWTYNQTGAPSVSGCSLTWTLLGSVQFDAGNTYDLHVFKGVGTATTGALTFSGGGGEAFAWSVFSLSGTVNAASPVIMTNIVTNSGSGTTVSASLGAFEDAANDTVTCLAAAAGGGVTPKGGWTELIEHAGMFGGEKMQTQYIGSNDASPTAELGLTALWGVVAFEIDEAAGGASPSFNPAWARGSNQIIGAWQ